MLKRILSVLLICILALTVCGCGGEDGFLSLIGNAVEGYSAVGATGTLTLADETLKCASENEYIALYYNEETYVVTIFDKRTGKSYTTAPSEEAPSSMNTRLAALNLIYSNSQGKNGSIDSYTKSVLLNQVEVKKEKNSVTFNYSIGDVSAGLEVTPSMISNERFEKLLDKATPAQQKALKRRYSYIKDYDNWSRRKIASPKAIADFVALFEELGYTAEDLAIDNKENNVSAMVEEKIAFFVPLKFTLDKDSVVVSIDMSKVTYPKSNPLIMIEFLQFFGAVSNEEETGYFLLPDGSGAIMPFKTVENGAVHYEAEVYGPDNALRQKATVSPKQAALMPVFGASYIDGGFLSVIEDGESLANIYAYNKGSTDNYNKVYSTLKFLKTESVSLGEQKADDNFNYYNFQKENYKGNYTVRYIFLENGKQDYSGMANAYRSYLKSTNALSTEKRDGNSPFVLETVGGILADKQFLGFQYKGITALTSYDDNVKMADELASLGINNINLRLTAFSGDGMQNTVPTSFKFISELGGKSAFKKLVATAKEKGYNLYPDFEYLTFSANSGVGAKNKYAISSMDYKSASIEVYNKATIEKNIQISDNLYYLMKIAKLPHVNESVRKFLDKYGIKSLSIADMAGGVSSDFSDKNSYDRQSATNLSVDLIGQLKDYSLMLNAANVRTAKMADIIVEAPLWSSLYEFTTGVPFYSMVYHGSVNYTGKSINLSADAKTEFLRTIEYGAGLKYTLVYQNAAAVKKSDYTELYSAEFEDSKDLAAANYKAVNELYKKTSSAEIIAHKSLTDSVFVTEYSNGVLTVVNYGDVDYQSEYGTVKAKDYIVKEG